jgi:hypothetical protein
MQLLIRVIIRDSLEIHSTALLLLTFPWIYNGIPSHNSTCIFKIKRGNPNPRKFTKSSSPHIVREVMRAAAAVLFRVCPCPLSSIYAHGIEMPIPVKVCATAALFSEKPLHVVFAA